MVVNGALAFCVLFFVLDLSRSDRGSIDWAVIGAVSLAVVLNLVRLGQRLHPVGGVRALALESVAVAFAIAGVVTTDIQRGAHNSPWATPASTALLVIAIAAGVPLYRMERAALAPGPREVD